VPDIRRQEVLQRATPGKGERFDGVSVGFEGELFGLAQLGRPYPLRFDPGAQI
jgi:hypothetical protein